MNIAYIRVSTAEQNSTTGRQSLDNFPVPIDRTFIDHGFSGGNADRPSLREMLDFVREGDTIYCYDLTRLARSVRDYAKIVEEITKKGVRLCFVKEGLSVGGKNDPTQTLFLSVLSALAQWELEISAERRREGIAKARERNGYANCGRKKVLTAENMEAIKARLEAGESVAKISRELGISRNTIYRYCK